MKGWWIAAAASVAVHLLVFVAAYTREPPAPPPRTTETIRFVVRDAPAPEPEPEAPAEPAAEAAAERPVVARAPRTAPRTAPKVAPTAEATPTRIDAPRIATEEEASVLVPSPDAPSTEWRPGRAGGPAGPVAPDAVAHLGPKVAPPSVHDAPIILPRAPPPAPDTRLKPQAGGGYVSKHQSFTGHIAHDGTIEFEDHIAGYTGLGFWFDVTDTVMMAAGDDAYSAAKLRLLEDTRDQRLAMAAEACEERLDQTLYALRGDLENIWKDSALTVDAKRRMIFQLWDDCAEEGAPSVVDHGKLARVTIVEFVKKVLPEGSPFAYTPDELVALNGRRASKQRFEPYANRP